MRQHTGLLFTVILLTCSAYGLKGANLVTNGSFEQGAVGIGSFQGWQTNLRDTSTFVDSTGQTGSRYGQAFDGLWAAYFGSAAAIGGGSISQTLSSVAGQEYQLTFQLANDNGGSSAINSFLVTVGNTSAFSFSNLANQQYVGYRFSFVAASAQTPLTFSGSNDNGYLELDAVSVASIPEPAEASLVIAGCLLLGLVWRRRQHKTQLR